MHKTAVISDIHGNIFALRAAIEDARRRGAESFIVTGDLITD